MWHQIDLNSENTREVRWRLLGFEVKLLPNKDFNYSRLDIIIDISVCKPDVKGLRDMNLAKSLYRCHDWQETPNHPAFHWTNTSTNTTLLYLVTLAGWPNWNRITQPTLSHNNIIIMTAENHAQLSYLTYRPYIWNHLTFQQTPPNLPRLPRHSSRSVRSWSSWTFTSSGSRSCMSSSWANWSKSTRVTRFLVQVGAVDGVDVT